MYAFWKGAFHTRVRASANCKTQRLESNVRSFMLPVGGKGGGPCLKRGRESGGGFGRAGVRHSSSLRVRDGWDGTFRAGVGTRLVASQRMSGRVFPNKVKDSLLALFTNQGFLNRWFSLLSKHYVGVLHSHHEGDVLRSFALAQNGIGEGAGPWDSNSSLISAFVFGRLEQSD